VVAVLLAAASLIAQPRQVWEIGTFDQSSREFSAGGQGQVVFRVGQSDWRKDWPGEQIAGRPFRIDFELAGMPKGVFTLKIAALTYRPRVPSLQVDVNGKRGVFYLQPKVSYYLGDQRSIFDPHYSMATLEIALPPDYLRQGSNRLILTCLDNPPEEGAVSGLHYDALSLSNDEGRQFSGIPVSARVTPTVFYRQRAGKLAEVVEATVRFQGQVPAGKATLEVNGQRYTAAFPRGNDFGETRVEFEAAEWTGAVRGRLEVDAGATKVFDVALTPERKWTVFLVPHTHLDVGYTDFQGKVAEAQARVLGQVSDSIRQHPDFRFAMDDSWILEQFLTTRSKARQDEVLDLIRQGKVALPAQYLNLLTGYASLETLNRSLYYSKELTRQYGLPFEYANITDVPSYTGAYPSILAGAGIKYWAAGGNNDRAPILSHEQWNEKSPFWWEGPDGKKVLFWYSRCYEQVMFLFGLPPGLSAVRDSLPIFLQAYSSPSYKPDAVLLYGTQQENTDLYPTTATFAGDWNKAYSYPKLQYSTFPDFFHYVADRWGKELPTVKGDAGPYWEDGVGSDAYYTAQDRENQGRALSAEILSTATQQINRDLHPPEDLLRDIWKNLMLFAEHTWTAGNSVSAPDHVEVVKQLEVKDSRATVAKLEIDDLMNRSLGQLADQIHVPARTLVFFNSLNWKRDALVETDLEERAELVDLTTGQMVPVEAVSHNQGFQHVRFLVRDLPPVGYKCFQVRRAAAALPAAPAATKEAVVENAFYRIRANAASGAIASIYDKQLGRELVDQHSPYQFGQYLYVTGGDGQTRMINPFQSLPLGQLTVHAAGNGELLGLEKTPWGYSLRLRSQAVNTPAIETEVLLYDGAKKIEFRYHVQKNYTTAKEGVYFAFPVALSSPGFAYATQQGWVDPASGLLKGASLEWFNIQYWMAARDSHLSVGIVPLNAPLASFGDINRGEWPGEFHPKTSTLFSYAMNNYWHTNYRAGQGGGFDFRYVLTSAEQLDPVALSRLGWESMRPIELDNVIGQDKVGNPERPLPPQGASFLEVDAPNVVLVTWKRAEDGRGTILRLQETAGRPVEAALHFPQAAVRSANLCSGVEDDDRSLVVDGGSLKLTFQPLEVLTVRLVQ
jgi:hypothetical protein